MKIFHFLGIFLVLRLVQSSVYNAHKGTDDNLEASENMVKVNTMMINESFVIEVVVVTLPASLSLSLKSLSSLESKLKSNSIDNESKKINLWLSLNSDILILIGKFFSFLPQRELGRIDKFFSQIFLRVHPFHRIVSEYFNISELLLAKRDDDLFWFEDKFGMFKKDSNHFFILFLNALFVDNKFSYNARLLSKYVARVYNNFDLEMVKKFYCVDYLLKSILNTNTFYHKFAQYLHEQQFYDVLIPFLLNDPGFPSINGHDVLSVLICEFRLPFYQELLLGPNGLANFYKFYDLNIERKHLISGILATDKSVEILNSCLNNLIIVKEKIKLFNDSFDCFFKNIRDVSDMEIEELNGIYERNLNIFSNLTITSFTLKFYFVLNEIYFSPENNLTDHFILANMNLDHHFIKCLFQKNRPKLLSRLLNFEDKYKYIFIYRIERTFKSNLLVFDFFFLNQKKILYLFEFSEANLDFYFKFYKKYTERKFQLIISKNHFENILNFYFISDFIELFEQSTKFLIVMELKQQYRHQNLDLPFKYVYHYNSDKDSTSLSEILKNYSGLNENSLIQLIKVVLRLNNCESYLVSDNVLKMFLASENLYSFFSSYKPNFRIKINSRQLMNLIKYQNVKSEELKRINNLIKYHIDDFDFFSSDLDFLTLESLTGISILVHVVDVILSFYLQESFYCFIKIRKALHYLLKTNRESLKRMGEILIDFLIKEAPEERDNLLL